MDSNGTVREYDDETGVGVIDSPDTPGGCWVHFSAVAMEGYRSLNPGEKVSFTFESFPQDGFTYRAVEVWRPGTDERARYRQSRRDADPAYLSELKIYPDGE